MTQQAFIDIWIGYAALGIGLMTLAFVWAVRTGQFTRQEHAARIPLEGGPQPDSEPAPPAGRADRAAYLVMLALFVTGMLAAILITARAM